MSIHATRVSSPSPVKFIPLAEDPGFVVALNWVLRTASLQVQVWQEAHPWIGVAVNLPPHHFKRQEVVQTVRRVLEETGLAPLPLEMEITNPPL